jgi:hypothetical protein
LIQTDIQITGAAERSYKKIAWLFGVCGRFSAKGGEHFIPGLLPPPPEAGLMAAD